LRNSMFVDSPASVALKLHSAPFVGRQWAPCQCPASSASTRGVPDTACTPRLITHTSALRSQREYRKPASHAYGWWWFIKIKWGYWSSCRDRKGTLRVRTIQKSRKIDMLCILSLRLLRIERSQMISGFSLNELSLMINFWIPA